MADIQIIRCAQPISSELLKGSSEYFPGLQVGDVFSRAKREMVEGDKGFTFVPTKKVMDYPVLYFMGAQEVVPTLLLFGDVQTPENLSGPFVLKLTGSYLKPLFASERQMMEKLYQAYEKLDGTPIRLTTVKHENRGVVYYRWNFDFS